MAYRGQESPDGSLDVVIFYEDGCALGELDRDVVESLTLIASGDTSPTARSPASDWTRTARRL
jgi:hypothetical protein